jgi:hypothetical protein
VGKASACPPRLRGDQADVSVLSADPLTVQETQITDIVSQMTMVGGKIVYETPAVSLQGGPG